jgi:small subunit ribosomal protein S9
MTETNAPASESPAPPVAEAPVASPPAIAIPAPAAVPAVPQGKRSFIWGVGRRKSAVARVRLAIGTGKIEVNGRTLNEYFTAEKDRKAIFGPLEVTNTGGRMDVLVNTRGGGPTGQTGAIVMGLGRALAKYDVALEVPLRNSGFLTRDSRMKERKKYGQRGARRRFQFSKR